MKILEGKRVLVVDDEQDVLDVLLEILHMCMLDTATSFEEAKRLFEINYYDIAILDIMGVQGFDLLQIANKKGVPALMLTAHALHEKALEKSVQEGASYFVAKEEIRNIEQFVADVLEAKEKKKNPWAKWYERLGGYYDRKFQGTHWREKQQDFWEKKLKGYSAF